jgi:peptidoglycan/xylan/chitin deacetylase (PgdA/CDA1 family)
LGDRNLDNFFQFDFSDNAVYWMKEGEWAAITLSWSGAGLNGSPDRANIQSAEIRVNGQTKGPSAGPVVVHVGGIGVVDEPAAFPHGVVSFTFDDGWASPYEQAYPALHSNGFSATLFPIVELVGGDEYMTLPQLQELHRAGWEVGVHAYSDAVHTAGFPLTSAAELEQDIVAAKKWTVDNDLGVPDNCSYPHGYFLGGPTDVLELVPFYFGSCRTIFDSQQETYPPADPYRLRVLLVTNATPLEHVEKVIDDAWLNRDWVILVFHRLVDAPAWSTEWSSADFRALVDYVAASRMPVMTVGQVRATDWR